MKTNQELCNMGLRIIDLTFAMAVIFFHSCRIKTVQPETREVQIIELDTVLPSPVHTEPFWQPDDAVAIIDSAETFKTDCTIIKEGFNLRLIETGHGKSRNKIWLTEDEWYQYDLTHQLKPPIKSMAHGYKIHIGSGRLSRTEWIAADKVFPVPWHHNSDLKIKDSIFVKRFGDFAPYKGIVVDTPGIIGGQFVIKYDGYDGRNLVDFGDVYKNIGPVITDKIKPGDILYFQNMYWVMVVGIKDPKSIIVRSEGFPARDKIVPVSTLQLLQ